LTGSRWCDTILLNVHAPAEDRSDGRQVGWLLPGIRTCIPSVFEVSHEDIVLVLSNQQSGMRIFVKLLIIMRLE